MEKPVELEVGNMFVIRRWEPEIHMMGVVTEVGERFSTAIVVETSREHKFRKLEGRYVIDMEEDLIEVLELPSEVLA